MIPAPLTQAQDRLILPFNAPVPPQDVPRFELMAGDLQDWISHSRHFGGVDTIQLWNRPAETARGFEAVVDCMTEAGDVEPSWEAADDFPIEHVRSWAAMNRPGVIVDEISYEVAAEWFATYGTAFQRPELDIHGDRLPPRPPTGPSRADEVIEDPVMRPFASLTLEEQAAERAEQAEIRRRDVEDAPLPRAAEAEADGEIFSPEWAATIDDALTAAGLPPRPKIAPKPARNRFTVFNAADLEAMPAVANLIKNVLPATGIGVIFGPSKSAKSFLVTDMLDALSRGRSMWFGHKIPSPVNCIYVGLEGAGGIPKRMRALGDHKIRVILPGTFDLRSTADRVGLVEAVREAGAAGGVLVIDTLAQACPGFDENSGKDMSAAIGALNELQAAIGGLVLVLHHSGKDASRGMRGHSSLLAALDVSLGTLRDGDRRSWYLEKSKDDDDNVEHAFRLRTVPVGLNADGEPVTSCVIQPDEAPGKPRKELPRGDNQRIVFSALKELLRAPEASAPDDAPEELPQGRPAVRLDEAVEKAGKRLATDDKHRTQRTREAINGLSARGILVNRGGWLWLA